MYLLLEREMNAQTGQTDTKKSKKDANFDKRLIWERNKRYEQNEEKLRTTKEEQRRKKNLNGPSANNMQNQTTEIQNIIKLLQDRSIDQLWNFHQGNIKDKEESQKLLDIYFLFLEELNKQRQKARMYSEKLQKSTTPIGNQQAMQPILFLDSNFPKRWAFYANEKDDYMDEIEQIVSKIKKHKTILMLYFPNMDKLKKTPNDDDDSEYDDEDEVVEYN